MPLRRRMKPRRKAPKRRMARRPALSRQVHAFKRIANLGTYTASVSSLGAPTPAQKGFSFQLVDLPNVAEYTSLFDQYKIQKVVLKIVPKTLMTQGASTGNAGPTGYGQVVTAIDYDDAATPSSKDELLEYGSAKYTQASRVHTRTIRPKVLNAVWVNSISTGYAPRAAPFIDNANNNVPHYGIKMWIDAPSTVGAASSASYDVYATYYFLCKNTR